MICLFSFRHSLNAQTVRALFLLLLLFWNCKAQTPSQEKGTVIARVGEAVLTLEALEASIPEQMNQQISAEEKQEMAERWVEKQLLYREALRRGVDQDPLVKKWVEQAEIDLIVNTLLKRELKEISEITEAEITQYYDEHQDEFMWENDAVRGRYIQVGARRKAMSIYRRLSRGASFEDIIAKGGPTEVSSGDLGYFSQDEVEDDLWKAVSNVKVGAFSQPVRTRSGYQIIQVLDRKKAGTVRELDDVRERIMDLLLFEHQKERVDQLIHRLRAEIPCEINTGLLRNHAE